MIKGRDITAIIGILQFDFFGVRMLTEAGGKALILSARNIGLTTIVKGMPGNMPGLSLTMSRG